MRSSNLVINCSILLCIILTVYSTNMTSKLKRNNVVIIVVDDMRHLPEKETVSLPSITKMARNGVYFKNTFAQQALCAPSRNSMLTGRRPDSTKLYDFYSYWRHLAGNFTTLPEYFKDNGYMTYSIGKIFNRGLSSNNTDDYPYSWSSLPYHAPTEVYKDAPVCYDAAANDLQSNIVCPVDVKEQPGGTLPDIEIYQKATEILTNFRNKGVPYFVAVGFHKPHIPLKYPKKYLDYYPLESIRPVRRPLRPWDMPAVAWQPWTDLRRRHDVAILNISFPYGTIPNDYALRIKQSYYAAWSYIDNLIGRLIEAIDFSNTVVVLTSDHGWSLGENGLWAKYSNTDDALKVPLIFRIPGVSPQIIHQPVELLDIFPTLVETCNLPHVKKCIGNENLCLEGKSLFPLMVQYKSVESSLIRDEEYIAYSQYPRPSVRPRQNTVRPRLNRIKIMGYTLRTGLYRYTEWIQFNHSTFSRNWDKVYAVELYDHSIDSGESMNVALRAEYVSTVHKLSTILRSKFK